MRQIQLINDKLSAIPSKEDLDKLSINKVGKVYIYRSSGLVYKLHHISESYREDSGHWGWIMMNNSFGYGGYSKDKPKTIEEAIKLAMSQGHTIYQVYQDDMFEHLFP
jgi:hypothetical protein